MKMIRYHLYVKWRFITDPGIEETQSGALAEGGPDEVGEDVYHPDKMIGVGPVFAEPEQAASYARERRWQAADIDIRPCEMLT